MKFNFSFKNKEASFEADVEKLVEKRMDYKKTAPIKKTRYQIKQEEKRKKKKKRRDGPQTTNDRHKHFVRNNSLSVCFFRNRWSFRNLTVSFINRILTHNSQTI